MNRDLTAVGQVWEDRKGRRRTVVGIEVDGQTYPNISDTPGYAGDTNAYYVIWQRDPTSKPRMAWCSTWESWVNHATLIQEDS